jgi:hypothetical protein
MKLALAAVGLVLGAGCAAVEYTQTDLAPSDLLAAGGALLRQKLTATADRCSDELVEFFLGAD